jgi:hypothetical protein
MTFENFIERHLYELIVVGLIVLGLVGGYFAFRRYARVGKHGFWDYVFIWPLLMGRKTRDGTRVPRDFTKREVIGWGIVIALGVVAVVFGL